MLMTKMTIEKIKSFFGFRKDRNEQLDEALLAVLEAALASRRLLAEHKEKPDLENVDFGDIPLLWSKAAVLIRHREKDMAVQCLYLAENFSAVTGYDGLQVEKVSQTLDAIFKTVKELLD